VAGRGNAGATSATTLGHMTIQRMANVLIVVDDLEAVIEFFVELGMELEGKRPLEGRWVERVIGLDGVRQDIAMLRTPDGHSRLELARFHSSRRSARSRRTRRRTGWVFAELTAYMNTKSGSHKVLFGTNYPMIQPAHALEGLEEVIEDDVARHLYLEGNARHVFTL